MVTRVIRNAGDLALLIDFLKARKRPFTVDIRTGKHRTIAQNKLQRLWLNEAAEQLGDRTPEDLRGLFKLEIGVPMLRAENDAFRERYDAFVRGLPYETKIAMMMEPLDMPVTRLMTTEQNRRYLERMEQRLIEMGVALTTPLPKDQRKLKDAA